MDNRKNEFIGDLKAGHHIESVFAVSKKAVKQKKNNEEYCLLTLQDKQGEIQSVMWTEAFMAAPSFEEGDLVAVRGMVTDYRGSNQLAIDKLDKIKKSKDIDYADYIKSTQKDIGQMWAELKSKVEEVKNPYLRKLLDLFFQDNQFEQDFCHGTAAVQYHHAYLGGLLEHTLYVCRGCALIAETYPNINRDLLIAGALLHDVGKIKEYEVGLIIKFTDQGKLLGHIAIGYSWVLEKINLIQGFPPDLKDRILHIILSHHGYKEYGSPKRPKILEALVVHHVDYMDAEIAAFNELLSDQNQDGDWSPFLKNLDRSVLLRKLDESSCNPSLDPDSNNGTSQEGLF